MIKKMHLIIILLLFFASCIFAEYDIVIQKGRVMDPESGTDKVMNIGISKGKIEAITKDNISGRRMINAEGLVVSPGFIDFLSYDLDGTAELYKVYDGVTTNLAMHGSNFVNFKQFFNSSVKVPVNYGGAVSQIYTRYAVKLMGAYEKPSKEKINEMMKLAKKGLDDGAMGINLSPEYVPGTTKEEMTAFFKLAAQEKVLITVHARFSEAVKNLEGVKEVIELARETHASAQIDHINSTGGTFNMKEALDLVRKAQKEGVDITLDTYPYDYWATYLASARFDGDWEKKFHISYNDLQIANTKERLTKDSFKKKRKGNPLTIAFAIPETDNIEALQFPGMMIGSDSIITKAKNNHPRGTGCFSRLIGKYARDKKTLTLMQALAECTINTAKRLENISPDMKQKGRIKVGADADITIFDYNKIIDKATPENTAVYSEGVEWVIVNGVIVKDTKGLVKKVYPGKPVKRR